MTTETGPQAQPQTNDDKLDARVLLVAGVVVLGAIMSILDITVVSVAQPTFQEEFDASPAEAAWTMTGYTLALASVIPLSGWAADRFGTKRLYMLAVLMFAAGSALCALATSIEMLVAFRVIQGLGGGMLMPVGMTIMTRAAGPERVGRVMAVLGIPMLLGPIFGPILGGWLIDAASWHWIFLINIPIGAVALVYAWRVLPKDHVSPSETFDWPGMLLLSPGLALFLFGVSSIPGEGTVWASRVLVSAAIGVALIVVFVFRELSAKRDHPLVDLHLFTNARLTIAVVAMALFAIAFFGASLLFPQYFLLVRGEDTLSAGLLLAPQGIGAMLTMPAAGTLTDRIGPGKIVLTGIAVIVVGMLGFTQVGVGVSDVAVSQSGVSIDTPSYPWLLGSLFVMGLGMGATMMPIMSSALATLKDHQIARGSTLMNINQQVAASIGTALFSVLLTNGFNDSPEASALRDAAQSGNQFTGGPEALAKAFSDMSHAFATSFTVGVVLVALCLIPVWFLPRKPQAKPVDPAAMIQH
ncbi:MAG TPA: DHA2 family efflux MFS transporter permease subunit [Nocardioides sp.]|uniref:DHA2 family efflux MFS transporter permease subunit n=1 Tax=Nocardioides sp. TaxID=35761 RepID=UPI002E329988|nr:DHA2 family efflux MFS transporter permease subunit [Nocardioides sp.]HEX5087743.1 DHA2 family efflux MFS transporter permease subunit [Nocardioides sp.]